MKLTTQYLGLTLAHPFMPGASPLDEPDMALRLEDAGAAAIVMHSLFEEDIASYSGLLERYLRQLQRLKQRAGIPIIASLNGTTAAGWLKYATLVHRAGADALELNFYHVATDPLETGAAVERRLLDIVAVLKETVPIPLAVKLSPFYSALPHLAAQLDRLGADGLVLFNRFYQPDIDAEHRVAVPQLHYSNSSELLLRLRWIAVLAGRIRASLGLTGGVHTPLDAVKAVLAGADAVQLVSAVIAGGPSVLTAIRDGFARWGDEHGFASVGDVRGSVSLANAAEPAGFERTNYMQVLRAAAGVAAPQ